MNATSYIPPRVLIIMRDQWPRAGLRAELRQIGYDAIGAPTLADALTPPVTAPARGRVALLIIDQEAVETAGREHGTAAGVARLARLRSRHGASPPPIVLLAHAVRAEPAGPWMRVVRRPFSIGDVVTVVRQLLPLPPSEVGPLEGEG